MSQTTIGGTAGVAVVAALACLGVTTRAQPPATAPAGRLNKIIEQFEQGKPAFTDEHWQFISLEHTLLLDNYAKAMASLMPTGGATRPRLAPIVRIPQSADEDFKSTVKQALDDGAFGIILPDVKTKEEVLK